ncbi:hypothetical protein HK101_008168 [Irineochytrium annulatum]|nr:hypothetical protein HK101_008168 [Irineochytrium annulatum]
MPTAPTEPLPHEMHQQLYPGLPILPPNIIDMTPARDDGFGEVHEDVGPAVPGQEEEAGEAWRVRYDAGRGWAQSARTASRPGSRAGTVRSRIPSRAGTRPSSPLKGGSRPTSPSKGARSTDNSVDNAAAGGDTAAMDAGVMRAYSMTRSTRQGVEGDSKLVAMSFEQIPISLQAGSDGQRLSQSSADMHAVVAATPGGHFGASGHPQQTRPCSARITFAKEPTVSVIGVDVSCSTPFERERLHHQHQNSRQQSVVAAPSPSPNPSTPPAQQHATSVSGAAPGRSSRPGSGSSSGSQSAYRAIVNATPALLKTLPLPLDMPHQINVERSIPTPPKLPLDKAALAASPASPSPQAVAAAQQALEAAAAQVAMQLHPRRRQSVAQGQALALATATVAAATGVSVGLGLQGAGSIAAIATGMPGAVAEAGGAEGEDARAARRVSMGGVSTTLTTVAASTVASSVALAFGDPATVAETGPVVEFESAESARAARRAASGMSRAASGAMRAVGAVSWRGAAVAVDKKEEDIKVEVHTEGAGAATGVVRSCTVLKI